MSLASLACGNRTDMLSRIGERPTMRAQSPVKDVLVGRECSLALSINIDRRGHPITGQPWCRVSESEF